MDVQKCVPVECSVSELNSARGKRSPAYGRVSYGTVANVSCNAGYRVKPPLSSGYSGANALCFHPTRFSLECDGSACGFPASPVCSKIGCAGLLSNLTTTTDGLAGITFKYFGRTSDPTVDGQLQAGHFFAVTCPGSLYIINLISICDQGADRRGIFDPLALHIESVVPFRICCACVHVCMCACVCVCVCVKTDGASPQSFPFHPFSPKHRHSQLPLLSLLT